MAGGSSTGPDTRTSLLRCVCPRTRDMRDGAEVGKQPYDGFVRLAVSRRGRRSYQQPAVTDLQYFVAARTRLHTNRQDDIVAKLSHAGLATGHAESVTATP